ncbi:MAG: glycosyltransferase involved in cell wall biosynthesis [Planctomycetota bacterium]|jgi:glycosyltransferase involved in cell wall biosynthesis
MKILHVITTLDVGGAEMHILSQVRGQSERGHSVRVMYLRGHGSLVGDFLKAGAERVEMTTAPFFDLMAAIRHADLIHSHLLKADMLVAVLASLCLRRKRLISGKHNDEQVMKRPLVSGIHAVLGNLPSLTIVLSDHVGKFVERYGHVRASSLRRVYYGIDPRPFIEAAEVPIEERNHARAEFGFEPENRVFICVARFAAQKAHDVLLKAFAEARQSNPDIRLLLVGDDPFGDGRERAEALALQLELGDDVIFAGIRRDVPVLIGFSDVFVMSSLWEGLGLVFLEAMAASRPVLASGVSAVPEVVLDGETGLLVPPSDVPALAAGFLRLAENPNLCEELGQAGRKRVHQHFGLDRMVEETLAIYTELVG